MTFAEVMDRIGLDATTEQYGDMFRDSKYSLWHANAGARRNLNRGIKAPMSGHPDYNVHANDIDFQIEADFIGLMCPGLPQASNHYADRVGRVMNYGDGLYGGMFFGAMYAAAYFETDPHRVVEAGPPRHPGREPLRAAHPRRAGVARRRTRRTGGRPGSSSRRSGTGTTPARTGRSRRSTSTPASTAPTSCSASCTATATSRRRWRSRPAPGRTPTATPRAPPAILGVMLGYERIPEQWKAGIPALADTKFEFTRYSFNEIVKSTLTRAEKIIVAAGGTVGPGEVVIPVQSPKAPPLEQWDPGVPVARVEPDQPAWSWKGGWTAETLKNEWSSRKVRQAGGAGDQATLAFEGTGVAIVGTMSQEGGRADVYLDGAKAGEIDAWIPERTNDDDYWHFTGLAHGPHTVRIVVRGDADGRSKGRLVQLERAIVYGPRP